MTTNIYQTEKVLINISEQMCTTGRNGEGNVAQKTKLGKYTVEGYKLSLMLIQCMRHTLLIPGFIAHGPGKVKKIIMNPQKNTRSIYYEITYPTDVDNISWMEK